MTISERIAAVRQRIEAAVDRCERDPASVRLIGVVKGMVPAALEAAIAAGLTDIGENFVQEAVSHRNALDAEVREKARWHLIGHLQRNKASAALGLFDTIQTVDSLRLAEHLDDRADRRLPVLIEVNVAGEAAKQGVSPAEVAGLVQAMGRLHRLEPAGLMTVAPAAEDPEAARPTFRTLRELAEANGLRALSMGMTNDYEVAIEEGATMVRIGRAIFGERPL